MPTRRPAFMTSVSHCHFTLSFVTNLQKLSPVWSQAMLHLGGLISTARCLFFHSPAHVMTTDTSNCGWKGGGGGGNCGPLSVNASVVERSVFFPYKFSPDQAGDFFSPCRDSRGGCVALVSWFRWTAPQ